MQWMNHFWGNGPGMILFWIIVIAGIAVLVRMRAGRPGTRDGSESALEILKRRYARGEISREEFDRMKRDIR